MTREKDFLNAIYCPNCGSTPEEQCGCTFADWYNEKSD